MLLTYSLLTRDPTHAAITTLLTHLSTHPPLLAPPLSIPLRPPPPLLIYLILFASPSLSTLSHLCSLLASYKQAFESNSSRDQEHISLLNAALIDTCNLLFRARAFNGADAHASGCLLPPPVVAALSAYTSRLDPPQPLPGFFSLSHHPTTAALSIAAFREVEGAAEENQPGSVAVRHAGPVSQKSLMQLGREGGVKMGWKEYRVL